MKELMVVAIGGHSILTDKASQPIEHLAQAVLTRREAVR